MYSNNLFEENKFKIFSICGVFKPNVAFGLVTLIHMARSGLN